RDHAITRLHDLLGGDGDRLLADVEVEKAADLAARVSASGRLFEAADPQHVAVVSQDIVAALAVVVGPELGLVLGVEAGVLCVVWLIHGEPSGAAKVPPARGP